MRHVINNRVTRPLHDRKRAHIHTRFWYQTKRAFRQDNLLLPVLAHFSATFPMSHGDRNCPFFILMIRPVLPAAISRSVCRAGNAGICSTSQTSAAACACDAFVYVSKNRQFEFGLDLARIRKPSFSPGPRNAFTEDRLALSYDALKMYGTPASAAIFATFSAIIRACFSLSITHGPAIRNRGFPPPRRNAPSAISRVVSYEIREESASYLGYAASAAFATI